MQNFDIFNKCLDTFDNVAWNLMSFTTLFICFFGHISLIVYLIMMKKSIVKKSGDAADGTNKCVTLVEFVNGHKTSTATLNPLSLSPIEEKQDGY